MKTVNNSIKQNKTNKYHHHTGRVWAWLKKVQTLFEIIPKKSVPVKKIYWSGQKCSDLFL